MNNTLFSVLEFLPWAYLSSALGLILIKSQSITSTAAKLRDASRVLCPESGLKNISCSAWSWCMDIRNIGPQAGS
jgi:hypothetical protein